MNVILKSAGVFLGTLGYKVYMLNFVHNCQWFCKVVITTYIPILKFNHKCVQLDCFFHHQMTRYLCSEAVELDL